jgi:hypothetical protein
MACAAQQIRSSKTDHCIELNLALSDVTTFVSRNVL